MCHWMLMKSWHFRILLSMVILLMLWLAQLTPKLNSTLSTQSNTLLPLTVCWLHIRGGRINLMGSLRLRSPYRWIIYTTSAVFPMATDTSIQQHTYLTQMLTAPHVNNTANLLARAGVSSIAMRKELIWPLLAQMLVRLNWQPLLLWLPIAWIMVLSMLL